MNGVEYLLLGFMAYIVIGFTIGALEIGGPTYNKSIICMKHPILYLIGNILLWPLFYIIINRIFVTQKIIKIIIIFFIVFFIQKFILYFIIQYIGTSLGIITTLIVTFFITLFLFGVFRMPGFNR